MADTAAARVDKGNKNPHDSSKLEARREAEPTPAETPHVDDLIEALGLSTEDGEKLGELTPAEREIVESGAATVESLRATANIRSREIIAPEHSPRRRAMARPPDMVERDRKMAAAAAVDKTLPGSKGNGEEKEAE